MAPSPFLHSLMQFQSVPILFIHNYSCAYHMRNVLSRNWLPLHYISKNVSLTTVLYFLLHHTVDAHPAHIQLLVLQQVQPDLLFWLSQPD
jgi:hypothetical protein